MKNKITTSDLQLSNSINVSCYKISVLREAVKRETNQIVIEALEMAIKAERNPVDRICREVIKH